MPCEDLSDNIRPLCEIEDRCQTCRARGLPGPLFVIVFKLDKALGCRLGFFDAVWHHPRLSRAHHCDDRVCSDLGNAVQALLVHTVRRSVITLTMQPAPANLN